MAHGSHLHLAAVVCLLICVASSQAFFAPFLHESASPTPGDDDDIDTPWSRARRNIAPVVTPDFLDHSTSEEFRHLEQQKNSSSMFMVELFESLYTGHNLVNPSPQECRAIEAADTVRSYIGHIKDSNSSSSSAVAWSTYFPTFDQPTEENIQLAELRLHLNSTSDFSSSNRLILKLRQWVMTPCDDAALIDHQGNCRKRQLLHTREIDAHHDNFDGREVFDITKVLQRWLVDARKSPAATAAPIQYDIELRLKSDDVPETGGDRDKAAVKAIISSEFPNALDFDIDNDDDDSADDTSVILDPAMIQDVTMVVFSRAPQASIIINDAFKSSARHRRSTEDARRRKKEKEMRKYQRDKQKQRIEEKLRMEQEAEGPCRRVDMDVDFGRIGWDEWIIYPKIFNAFRCVGTCAGPLDSSDNPSNHAIMQDLIRLNQPERRTPEPCCVPTKLKPLSMLYFEEGAVLVRHHENMIVEECGCR